MCEDNDADCVMVIPRNLKKSDCSFDVESGVCLCLLFPQINNNLFGFADVRLIDRSLCTTLQN